MSRDRATVPGKRWGEVLLRWPFERVPVDLEVVTTRELTTLEWVLERILDEFPEAPPTLREAAEELGLADEVFLHDTLEQLVEMQAIEQRGELDEESSGELDLSTLQFTESGRELFRIGKIDGLPDHPRIELTFDMLTGLHAARPPKEARPQEGYPLLNEEELPEPTAHLSLEKVRTCVQERGERYQQGNTRIRAAEVVDSGVSRFWAGLRATLYINPQGVVAIAGSFESAQLSWLEEQAPSVFDGASLQELFDLDADEGYPLANEAWLAQRDELISDDELEAALTKLLDAARREVIVDGCWQNRVDLADRIAALVARGIHCLILEESTVRFRHWRDRVPDPPGFAVEVGVADADKLPLALVVDGEHALVAEQVTVLSPSKDRVCVVLGTRTSGARARELRKELLGKAADEVADWGIRNGDERAQLAALFLGASSRFARHLMQVGVPEGASLDRVAHYRRMARWFKERPDSTPTDFVAAAREALDEYLDDAGPLAGGELGAVIEQADGLLPPERLLERLLERVVPTPALSDPEPLASIDEILTALRKRFALAKDLPALRRVLDHCLEVPAQPIPPQPELVARVVHVAGDERARRWAARISGQWGQPNDVAMLERWLRAHAAIRQLLGPGFSRLAQSFLQRVAASKSSQLEPASLDGLQEAWTCCALPAGAVNNLLRKSPPRADGGSSGPAIAKKKKEKNRRGKR